MTPERYAELRKCVVDALAYDHYGNLGHELAEALDCLQEHFDAIGAICDALEGGDLRLAPGAAGRLLAILERVQPGAERN
jgi:hypothetical protein